MKRMILHIGLWIGMSVVCTAQNVGLPGGDFDVIAIPVGGAVNPSLSELGLMEAPVVGLDGTPFPPASVSMMSEAIEITLQAGEAVLMFSAPFAVTSDTVHFSCLAQTIGEALQQSALALIDAQDANNLGVNLAANNDIPRVKREYSIEYQPKTQNVQLLMQFIGPVSGEATVRLEHLRILDGFADADYSLGATRISRLEHFPVGEVRRATVDRPPSTDGATLGFNRQENRTRFPNTESGSLLMISTSNEDVLQISIPLEMPEVEPRLSGETVRVYARVHVKRISGTQGIFTAALFSGVTGGGGYTQHEVELIPDDGWLEIETPVQFLNESTDVLLLILQIRDGSAVLAVDDLSLHARRESPYFWDSGLRSIPTNTPTPTPTRVAMPPVQPVREVPAGFFIRGSRLVSEGGEVTAGDESRLDELPQRQLFISGYKADRFEVSNAFYHQFWSGLEGEEKTFRRPGRNAFNEDFETAVANHPDHPVVSIDWEDAVAFCEWRTWFEGIRPPLAYRLPTEAEWEYMARGETPRRFPWGDDDPDVPVVRANFRSLSHGVERDGFPLTAPVNSFFAGASPFGILNLAGNVFEWCLDLYDPDYYAVAPERDPMGPEETGSRDRVIRGGSWDRTAEDMRAAHRVPASGSVPGSIGFRCVLSTVQPTPTVTPIPPVPTATYTPLPTSTNTPVPPPSPTPKPFEDGQIVQSPVLNIDMVYHPTGSFARGNDSATDDFGNARTDEIPRRNITVTEFFMDRFEVTTALYRRFVQETGHPNRGSIDDLVLADSPDNPVVEVSYFDALAFCAWRSASEGVSYRLPTEAEWEYAARFNTVNVYPWGNESPALGHANFLFEGDGFDFLAPVNAFETGVSLLGVFNLAGNAAEWCLDWYGEDYYIQSPSIDPTGPEEGSGRVVRGGSWFNQPLNIRNAARASLDPQQGNSRIGFRCVRSLQ